MPRELAMRDIVTFWEIYACESKESAATLRSSWKQGIPFTAALKLAYDSWPRNRVTILWPKAWKNHVRIIRSALHRVLFLGNIDDSLYETDLHFCINAFRSEFLSILFWVTWIKLHPDKDHTKQYSYYNWKTCACIYDTIMTRSTRLG
jgi:hypothetical protein